MNEFKQEFSKYVCVGDTISVDVGDITITATIHYDHDSHIDDDDCHNIDQRVTGCNDEMQAKLKAARAAWFNDEWRYVGIVLSATVRNIPILDNGPSLWALEANYPGGDNSWLREVANELLPEALEEVTGLIDSIKTAAIA